MMQNPSLKNHLLPSLVWVFSGNLGKSVDKSLEKDNPIPTNKKGRIKIIHIQPSAREVKLTPLYNLLKFNFH